jgi:hypothetical protein
VAHAGISAAAAAAVYSMVCMSKVKLAAGCQQVLTGAVDD